MTQEVGYQLSLVLMAGLPGAGKTTLATELGRTLQWFVLDKDTLKSHFLREGLENDQASWRAYERIFEHAYELLVWQRLPVIIDTSSLHVFILDRVLEIVKAAEAQLKVILCTVSGAERERRLAGRSTVSTGPLKIPANEEGLRRFTHLPTYTLHLNTELALDVCTQLALEYLKL